jgi:fructosamine-3-kinase
MNPSTRECIARALGCTITSASSVAGGDINQAWRVQLGDGQTVFVKTNPRAPSGLFETEARGLAWLEAADALIVPKVIAVGNGSAAAAYLVLEELRAAPPIGDFDATLGRGLAALHRHGTQSFGLDHDNFIGSLAQSNNTHPTWASFYAHERIGAQLELAVTANRASSQLRATLEQLIMRLPELVGPEEPPARLHGDLWSGNLHRANTGEPALIDPAVYGGHREIDLAMMKLFGGFSERVFAAYHEAYPLDPGHRERVSLYQLYPLLVHLNLFGGHYGESVHRAAQRYL